MPRDGGRSARRRASRPCSPDCPGPCGTGCPTGRRPTGAAAAPRRLAPLWAACLLPAGVWLLTVLATSVRPRRSGPAARSWRVMTLAPTGAVLVGAQVSVVRANLDHTDWHQARQRPSVWC
ncbi:hypothetical protein ACFQ3Z_23950 [Streptomyces nogalater]